jgi:uncharacterized short protein YbdD (DUF466 family)
MRGIRTIMRLWQGTLRAAHAAMRRMQPRMRAVPPRLTALWHALRTLTGDDAYERYLRHAGAHHPGEPLMTAREFWRDAERRKWSGVSRCC